MKVLNLRCAHDHGFEGWFASEADFLDQHARAAVACPLCGDLHITRLPSAPRLNLSGARAPTAPPRQPQAAGAQPAVAEPAACPAPAPAVASLARLHAQWLQLVQQVMDNTEDVGERFAEEARRIHYGEAAERGIRGVADEADRAALADEGIEIVALPLPAARKGPAH